MKSLKGCPVEISGHFDCAGNKISDLLGCPIKVSGDCDFSCNDNCLTSLVGCPKIVVVLIVDIIN